jgi:hypothetical protein
VKVRLDLSKDFFVGEVARGVPWEIGCAVVFSPSDTDG